MAESLGAFCINETETQSQDLLMPVSNSVNESQDFELNFSNTQDQDYQIDNASQLEDKFNKKEIIDNNIIEDKMNNEKSQENDVDMFEEGDLSNKHSSEVAGISNGKEIDKPPQEETIDEMFNSKEDEDLLENYDPPSQEETDDISSISIKRKAPSPSFNELHCTKYRRVDIDDIDVTLSREKVNNIGNFENIIPETEEFDSKAINSEDKKENSSERNENSQDALEESENLNDMQVSTESISKSRMHDEGETIEDINNISGKDKIEQQKNSDSQAQPYSLNLSQDDEEISNIFDKNIKRIEENTDAAIIDNDNLDVCPSKEVCDIAKQQSNGLVEDAKITSSETATTKNRKSCEIREIPMDKETNGGSNESFDLKDMKDQISDKHPTDSPENKISRKSIELIFDKSSTKPKPAEIVVIDESEEKITLDSSHDDSKVSEQNIRLDLTANNDVHKSCLDSRHCESSDDGTTNKSKSLQHQLTSPLTGSPKISDHELNDSSKNLSTGHQSQEIISISNIDNSFLEEKKGKCNLQEFTIDTEPIRTLTICKDINLNLKLKCLFVIDEQTKEIRSKEFVKIDFIPLTKSTPKNIDTSSNLADVSSDNGQIENKDSPSSVHSSQPLFALPKEHHRLSLMSHSSSSSSGSSAATLQQKLLSKNLDKIGQDTYEKFIKEWKNGKKIVSSLNDALNNDYLSGLCNASNDIEENIDNLHASTPERNEEKIKGAKVAEKTPNTKARAIKRASRSARNSKLESKIKEKSETPISSKKNKTVNNDQVTPTKQRKTSISSHKSNLSETAEPEDKLVNAEVFAKWTDKNFYPGVVKSVVDFAKKKYKVKFYDNQVKDLIIDFIIKVPDDLTGTTVHVVEEDLELPGIVFEGKKSKGKEATYVIETDQGKIKKTIKNIFLDPDQAKYLKEQLGEDQVSAPATPQQLCDINLDNLTDGKTRSKRATTSEVSTPRSKRSLTKVMEKSAKASTSGIVRKGAHSSKTNMNSSDHDLSDNIEENLQLLLGIQKEIIGTSTAEKKSGGGKKVKGIKRLTESKEVLEKLGPIPEEGSNIFKDMFFILSCVEPTEIDTVKLKTLESVSTASGAENDSESPSDIEKEWKQTEFARDRLKKQLTAGGGIVYHKFEDIENDLSEEKLKSIMHITNLPNRTKTALLCLSVGIKSYHHSWVIRCCKEKKSIPFSQSELPVGFNLENSDYLEPFSWTYKKFLDDINLVIPMGCGKEFVDLWSQICRNAGGTVNIIENKEQTFILSSVVLANRNCPTWVIDKAEELKLPILTTTWLTQCLIQGRLCVFNKLKEYKLQ